MKNKHPYTTKSETGVGASTLPAASELGREVDNKTGKNHRNHQKDSQNNGFFSTVKVNDVKDSLLFFLVTN